MATNMCPCGTTIESRTHILGKCEIYKEERDALEEMRELDECDKDGLGRLESSEKTIAILGGNWRPQTAEQDGDRMGKQFLCNIWENRGKRPDVGGVSIRSRNGTPSRKGCVDNGQTTKERKRITGYPLPPPPANINPAEIRLLVEYYLHPRYIKKYTEWHPHRKIHRHSHVRTLWLLAYPPLGHTLPKHAGFDGGQAPRQPHVLPHPPCACEPVTLCFSSR